MFKLTILKFLFSNLLVNATLEEDISISIQSPPSLEYMSTDMLSDNSEISSREEVNNAAVRKRFIRLIKKRIDYDSILTSETWNHSQNVITFEDKLIKVGSLSNIKAPIEHVVYDLPDFDFYTVCCNKCLLSDLLISKYDNNFINVRSFFIMAKITLESFFPEIIEAYLNEEKTEKELIDRICSVFECTRKLLISRTSFLSTLYIIKSSQPNWEFYCCPHDDVLLYAFVLLKRILCNINLPLETDLDISFEKVYLCGITNFNIEVITTDENYTDIEKTISLSKYLINHMITMIELISDDYKREKKNGRVQFDSSSYFY